MTLAGVLLAPDPDTSDHPPLAICAAVFALAAAVLLLWRRPPRAILHAICPGGTIAVTASVALAEPIGLTPSFYLWPMLVAAYFMGRREVAAYFMGRREVAANLAFAAGSCAVALTLWVEPGLRVAMFVAMLAIAGVATAVVVVLREQVLALLVQLRMLASHDSLTGALNRAFEQRLDAELARARRGSGSLSLVVFDVDHFKELNDSFGHAAGDRRCARSATSSRRACAARTSSAASAARSSACCCPTPASRAPRRWPTSCAAGLPRRRPAGGR